MDYFILIILLFLSYAPKTSLSFLLFLYDTNYFLFFVTMCIIKNINFHDTTYRNNDFIYQNDKGELKCKNHTCIFDKNIGIEYSLVKNSDIPYLVDENDDYKIIRIENANVKFNLKSI